MKTRMKAILASAMMLAGYTHSVSAAESFTPGSITSNLLGFMTSNQSNAGSGSGSGYWTTKTVTTRSVKTGLIGHKTVRVWVSTGGGSSGPASMWDSNVYTGGGSPQAPR